MASNQATLIDKPGMAVIGQVTDIGRIEGADRINRATVNCSSWGTWEGVVSTDVTKGRKVIVFMPDAVIGSRDERWAFMEKHQWRVRMQRFRGAPSECLIVPTLPGESQQVGADMSIRYGVKKYVKPLPDTGSFEAVDAFPSFLPKTDEINFQSAPELVERMLVDPFYVTEKADGTSCTAWVDIDGHFHVAGRNWEIAEKDKDGKTNIYWTVARKYGLGDWLWAGYALQFEVVGPGVQGNPMRLESPEARVFGGFMHPSYRSTGGTSWIRLTGSEIRTMTEGRIPLVRQIQYPWPPERGQSLTEWLRAEAGKARYGDYPGEGIVVRALDESWSFKAINLDYKDRT